jgi:RHS repeat-associated protein
MVYGFGQLLSEETPVGRTFIQSDQVGSPSFVTDAGGNLIGRTKNMPFGERFGASGTQSASRYAGHEDQPGSAIYMQARTYLPGYGRFAQPDPAYQFSSDGMNLYSYCSNNPVTRIDPTGMRDISGTPAPGPSGNRPHDPQALKPLEVAWGGDTAGWGSRIWDANAAPRDGFITNFYAEIPAATAVAQTGDSAYASPGAGATIKVANSGAYLTIGIVAGYIQIVGGTDEQRQQLAGEVGTLMSNVVGMSLLVSGVGNQDGRVVIYVIDDKTNAYSNDKQQWIKIDPGYTPIQQTTEGPRITPNFIVLAHEFGHLAGGDDVTYRGLPQMQNIIVFENPVRNAFDIPSRTRY